MRKILLPLLLMFVTSFAVAEEIPEWFLKAIKSPTPNELAYYIQVDEDCPISLEKAESVVEGVFIRSRLKPLKKDIHVDNRIYLNVVITCGDSTNFLVLYNINVNFARYRPLPAVIFDLSFGYFGFVGVNDAADYILQKLKERTEVAVTAHIKSNFDL